MYGYVMDGRLLALNENDMTGNSGWEPVATALKPEDRLTDEHGAALYKIVGGSVQERTQEEREADWPPEPTPQPTLAERITFVEDCLMEMSEEVYK